jgi:hypothetical protein
MTGAKPTQLALPASNGGGAGPIDGYIEGDLFPDA